MKKKIKYEHKDYFSFKVLVLLSVSTLIVSVH
jgi:hypothetical protein